MFVIAALRNGWISKKITKKPRNGKEQTQTSIMENFMDTNIENPKKEEITDDTVNTENTVENTEETNEANETKEVEALPEKTEIVGVRFKKEGKTYYFAPNGFTLKNGDKVIVETSRGLEYGYIAVSNTTTGTGGLVTPLKNVIRLATEEDTRIHSENVKKEIEAYNACIALIDEHNPKMKLIDVECAFDKSKLLFYFSAEERVDFREIVKSLANTFHTRIEMRQIGIRDEAKILGGLGVCGRPFCCSAFLNDFVQVSVKMAKEQNISLNAAKISGACGKLMCCLRYEYDTYLAEKALTPKVGARVVTPDGPGEVTESNPLAGIVKVRLDGKAEDAEQTAYVRDDVIKEEEYNGEKLTKTEIPKRGKSKEEDDVFASFASLVSGGSSVSAEEKKEPVKQSVEKQGAQDDNESRNKNRSQEKETPQNNAQGNTSEHKNIAPDGTEVKTQDGENRHGGNGRRRKKHKGHNRGGQNQNAQQNGQNQPGQQNVAQSQGQNASQNRGQGNQSREQTNGGQGLGQSKGQGKPENQNKNGGVQQNRNDQNGQGGGSRNKKKHFKPYHKRFDNNGNKGGQGSGTQQ